MLVLGDIASILHWICLNHHINWLHFSTKNVLEKVKVSYDKIFQNVVSWTWLLTSSLAWPAIKSLNIFSLDTFVSFVLHTRDSNDFVITKHIHIGFISFSSFKNWPSPSSGKAIMNKRLSVTFLPLIISFLKWLPSCLAIFQVLEFIITIYKKRTFYWNIFDIHRLINFLLNLNI